MQMSAANSKAYSCVTCLLMHLKHLGYLFAVLCSVVFKLGIIILRALLQMKAGEIKSCHNHTLCIKLLVHNYIFQHYSVFDGYVLCHFISSNAFNLVVSKALNVSAMCLMSIKNHIRYNNHASKVHPLPL